MKILITSERFHPKVGGTTTVSMLLAKQFMKLKHEVRVISHEPSDEIDNFSYQVIRQPSPVTLWKNFCWCDVVLQQGASIKLGWPLLFHQKTSVVVHHIWQLSKSLETRLQRWLRSKIICCSTNLCVSKAIGEALDVPFSVINNLYDDEIFKTLPQVNRNLDLVYLGRLHDYKGVDLIIEALKRLQQHGLYPSLTVIGEGNQLENLKIQASLAGVKQQVNFLGLVTGQALVSLLNQHKIMVIPSRWNEPFGIVALEGIACGCVVVGSSGGGLPNAIGSCGLTFQNGNAEELTNILAELLQTPQRLESFRQASTEHLEKFKSYAVAQEYLTLFDRLVAQKRYSTKFFLAKLSS